MAHGGLAHIQPGRRTGQVLFGQQGIQHNEQIQVNGTKIIHARHSMRRLSNFPYVLRMTYSGANQSTESGMPALVLFLIALIAGALVPFQGGANAALGRALGHPLWAAIASLIVSLICILPALIALRVPMPDPGAALAQPKWIWIGGLVGIIYVSAAIFLMPMMGAAGFMIAVIAGQLIGSLIIDRFGLLGLVPKPFDLWRVLGAGLVLGGALLFQWPGLSRMAGG
ncbi:DMT family transporter [Pseudomonas sp. GX19020]|uniref:DMT family transporter n=1 Tax=Pseudomonas sp. GX19020 TaxID=2942277 RepID=UPI002018ABED|nr:DMT family transporter [Pseudomonas sp. GX19020]MCL4068824.1 DMT family transporter [Pseudomonas sp. GX19020]